MLVKPQNQGYHEAEVDHVTLKKRGSNSSKCTFFIRLLFSLCESLITVSSVFFLWVCRTVVFNFIFHFLNDYILLSVLPCTPKYCISFLQLFIFILPRFLLFSFLVFSLFFLHHSYQRTFRRVGWHWCVTAATISKIFVLLFIFSLL